MKLKDKLAHLLCIAMEIDYTEANRNGDFVDLLDEYYIDSITVVKFLALIEEEFSIEIGDEILQLLDKNIISDIEQYIEIQVKNQKGI